jgi:hypothetical protein
LITIAQEFTIKLVEQTIEKNKTKLRAVFFCLTRYVLKEVEKRLHWHFWQLGKKVLTLLEFEFRASCYLGKIFIELFYTKLYLAIFITETNNNIQKRSNVQNIHKDKYYIRQKYTMITSFTKLLIRNHDT